MMMLFTGMEPFTIKDFSDKNCFPKEALFETTEKMYSTLSKMLYVKRELNSGTWHFPLMDKPDAFIGYLIFRVDESNLLLEPHSKKVVLNCWLSSDDVFHIFVDLRNAKEYLKYLKKDNHTKNIYKVVKVRVRGIQHYEFVYVPKYNRVIWGFSTDLIYISTKNVNENL
jgi:hypothetical protein